MTKERLLLLAEITRRFRDAEYRAPQEIETIRGDEVLEHRPLRRKKQSARLQLAACAPCDPDSSRWLICAATVGSGNAGNRNRVIGV